MARQMEHVDARSAHVSSLRERGASPFGVRFARPTRECHGAEASHGRQRCSLASYSHP